MPSTSSATSSAGGDDQIVLPGAAACFSPASHRELGAVAALSESKHQMDHSRVWPATMLEAELTENLPHGGVLRQDLGNQLLKPSSAGVRRAGAVRAAGNPAGAPEPTPADRQHDVRKPTLVLSDIVGRTFALIFLSIRGSHRRHGRLACSVALSGQAPKPLSGAPKARGLTANAPTELSFVWPRCAR